MTDLLTTHEAGERRILGCLPREQPFAKAGTPEHPFPDVREVVKTIPRNQWDEELRRDFTLNDYVLSPKNQGNEGSCTSNATTGTAETIRGVANADRIELSAMSVYRRVGSGPNSGSSLDANLRALASEGCLPVTGTPGFKHTHPRTGFSNRLPSGWEETGALFRAAEWWDVPNFESLVSCLFHGFPVVFGYHIGRGGHSIFAVRPIYNAGGWYADCVGSWGKTYNGDGHHVISEGTFDRGIRTFGAWALRVMTRPSTEKD